jgi:hypothetical protein
MCSGVDFLADKCVRRFTRLARAAAYDVELWLSEEPRMRRLPHYPDPEDHRVQRKWAKGIFVFYGVLTIVTAGFVFGNRLSNNPTHEMALAGAGGEKLQAANRAARPMTQATRRD